MLAFLARLFGRSTSSVTAKERLKLVLLSDHLALAPEVIDAMRTELLHVIARYCDIDPNCAEVGFEHRDNGIEMHATVPIRAMNGRNEPARAPKPFTPPAPSTPSVERGTDPAIPGSAFGATAETPAQERERERHEGESASSLDEDGPTLGGIVVPPPGAGKRRRRRRRKPSGAYPTSTGDPQAEHHSAQA